MDELIERVTRARIGETFNFYRDGRGAAGRRERLLAYLKSRRQAPFLLVGEAAGYRGARVSGIPFTSERQLTGRGLEEQTLCWNVVPTHPHLPGRPETNRRPTGGEVRAAAPLLEELSAGRKVIAVGRLAQSVLDAPYVRHPSHGGAADFRTGLLAFRPGGQEVRLFSET
jgi:hypothetical protein